MGLAAKKASTKRRGPVRNTSARNGATPTLSKEYQAVFETSGKAMVIVEEDATISLANAEFEKLSGYTKEEIEDKKNWTEFVARDDRKRVKEYHLLRRTDPMLAPRSFEFRFLDRQERVKNIVLTIGQIPGTNKSMASLLDVTDRRQEEIEGRNSNGQEGGVKAHVKKLEKDNEALQAEIADLKREVERLRESEERNRTLIDNIDLAINLIDADHNIVMANNALIKRRNTSVEELIGEKCYRALEKRDAVCPQCPGVQAMATGLPASVETEGAEDDPHRFPARLQAFPVLREDGTASGFIEVVEDITERKQMEMDLRQSEERFRRFADEASFEGFIVHDKGKILDVNKIFATMYGYERDELIGMNISETIASEYRKTVSKSVREKDEEPYEIMSLRKNGSTFPVEIHAKPFPFNGRIVRVAAVRDITERKQAEELLQQEKETFYTILQNALYGVGLIDSDGSYLYVNPEFTKITGYTLKDIPTGKDWMHKAYPDKEYRQKVIETWKKDIGVGTRRVFSVVCKDGETREIEFRPTQLDDGRNIVMFADITERKQAEEALRESEERFRMLAENIPFGISVMAPDRSFEYINPQFTKIFGYTIEDIPDKNTWFEKAYPDEEYRKKVSSQWTKDVKEKVEVGEENQRIFTVRCKDGKDKIIDFRTVYFKDGKKYLIYDDITDRAKAEEALRKSEGLYRTLAENFKFGLNLIDADYNIVMVNAALSKRLKKTANELIGKQCFREFEKRDAVCPQCPGIQAMATGKSAEVETERVRDDQRRLYMRLKAFPIIGQDGKATGFIEVIEDITERKLIEETLKQSEERYRALVENVHLGINLIDADHTILSVNAGQSSHFGKPRSETIGKKCYQEFEKRDAVCPQCPGVQTMATGQPTEAETEATRDDGSHFNVRLQTFPIFGDDGTVTSFIEVVEDITERKQMEEELRQTEDRFRKLVETMRVGLTSIDKKGVLTYANEQFCKILGYSMDEVIGRPTVDFYYDEQTRKSQEEVFTKRKKGMRDPAPYEIAWRTKDGRKVYTILSPTPSFDADGRYIGSAAIQTDITERKRAQEQLQRYAAELEQSNEEVKNFAYIVSHDLRVPLVNLKGYTSELSSALEVIGPTMETALPHLNEEKRSAVAMALHEDVPEALEFITNSVSRMDRFINSVLQLSRLGRRELKPEPIDMNTLVQTTLENLSHQIQVRGTKVTVESLPQVVADRTAMEQIMGNILGNAVKYLDTERHGQIEVTAQTNNGEQIFRIRDNGRGIAQEDMHKVFAPFRRAGKQDTQGEGMGLAYVQTLVRRQDGRIWCESELGKGTTFTFTISQHRAERGDHVAH